MCDFVFWDIDPVSPNLTGILKKKEILRGLPCSHFKKNLMFSQKQHSKLIPYFAFFLCVNMLFFII